MNVGTIRHRKSFEAWLNTRPEATRQAEAVALAQRSAARVFPLWGSAMGRDWGQQRSLTALPILRLLLVSGVAVVSPFSAVKVAVANARTAAAPLTRAAADAPIPRSAFLAAARAADAAAHVPAAAAHAARAADVAGGVAVRADMVLADAAFAETWKQIQMDARVLIDGKLLGDRSLWSGVAPLWFNKADADTRAVWAEDPPSTWDFWARWWDGVLSGQQMRWDLQRDVALIPDEDWKKGPAHLAGRIAGIEERYRAADRAFTLKNLDAEIAANPYAWRIRFDPKTQRFWADPIERRDLSDVVATVRASILQFGKRSKKLGVGNFGQSIQLAFKPVVELLRSDLRKYSSAPLSLFVGVERAREEMEDIAGKEGFASESYVTRFFLELQSSAEDICVASPEIVLQLKKKMDVRLELYTLQRKQQLINQTNALHLSAEDILKRVALESLRILSDDNSSPAAKQQAMYFATAVLPRAARAYLAETSEADEPDQRAENPSVIKRLGEAADTLSKLDKGKDALVENAPLVSDLVQSILSGLPPV